MDHYTQLNLNNKKAENFKKIEPVKKTGASRKTMMFTGLLLITTLSGGVLLISNGCSKTKDIAHQPQPGAASQPVAVNSYATPASLTATAPIALKMNKKKRSSVVTYNDATYGISSQYPRRYALKTGEKALAELSEKGSIPMDFTQPGGIALAAVELPKGSYPGTDLKSAVFNINVNRSLSASECEQFGTSELVRPQVAPPAKVLIGDAEFSQVEDISSEKNSETRYYHMFKNGACYEVALGLGVSEIVSESEVTPVNRQDIFSKLEKILWTVKVKATDDHEVAATVTVSGSGERQ